MPHTNRKKKNAGAMPLNAENKKTVVHTKRKEVLDEEGWVHVVDTPRTTRRSTISKAALHSGDFEINGVQYVNRTLEEMRVELAYWRKAWEIDEACAGLKTALEKLGEQKIGKVVVLGLGSLQNARREGRRASYTQLVALEIVMAVLGARVSTVFQDPQFTDTDKLLLKELGYEIVEDPEAFQHIVESSLVYAIHCYADVYKEVSEQKTPAVFIGTDVENFGRFNLSETAEVTAKALEEMVKGYESVDFPQIRHDFSDTKIYWRKKLEEVKPEVKPEEVKP
ncbi:hypothetical protein LSUE1_G003265 [Lachnellula suecica]|uniref:SRR1-like domain-containing protein n=1 Tax=Lachnellula suecica TaxID=602035 RepID=A0A8T9C582_9HELO|nr:hypothetical protein LSUE1_G003265 [Lachnellula suecica]